jgi:metal-responsive CopG/Arc/MetJ family transcriptional regulator
MSDAVVVQMTSYRQYDIIWHMRTTINLDDDVLREVKQYADSRSIALGKAVSELVRRGLRTPTETEIVNGLHVVVLPPESAKVDETSIKRLLEDEP